MRPILHAAPGVIDSRQAAWRLLVTLGLVVLGNSSMYVVSVVLPTVQAEFGIDRARASLPYTLMKVCLGLGGLWTGRMADRHGLMKVLWVGARVGAVIMATLVGMALGGWLSGWIFDLTGSHGAAFFNGIAWNLLNLAITGWLYHRLRSDQTTAAV